MTDPDGDWQAVAAAVKVRRDEVGLTQAALAALLGGSTSNVQRIERGDGGMRRPTIRALERALRWQGGSVEAILAGGRPAPAQESPVNVSPPVGEDITTVDAERAYEMLQSIRKVFGEAAYVDALARAVRARASGDDQKTG
ncbi:helix-turn-helix domain-containing protein [Actinokineospora sp.]|uniref:helix-turn-helix domain-containing protein n=1 Tax=Actinokineospora sp. TaxID=1872133 RepID=UPI003D6C1ABD